MRAVLVGRDKMESTLKERIIDVMEKALNIHLILNNKQYNTIPTNGQERGNHKPGGTICRFPTI